MAWTRKSEAPVTMPRVEMARSIPSRSICLLLLHLSPGDELHCPGGTFVIDDTAPTMDGDTTYSGEEYWYSAFEEAVLTPDVTASGLLSDMCRCGRGFTTDDVAEPV